MTTLLIDPATADHTETITRVCPLAPIVNGDPICPLTGRTDCDGADSATCPAC
jgi:hypothetical protein